MSAFLQNIGILNSADLDRTALADKDFRRKVDRLVNGDRPVLLVDKSDEFRLNSASEDVVVPSFVLPVVVGLAVGLGLESYTK